MIKEKRGNNLLKRFLESKQKRKAQVSVFVIVAIVLVAAIALVFMLFRTNLIGIDASEDTQSYISNCIQEVIEEPLEEIYKKGGYVSARPPSTFYNDEEICYLCYTEEYDEKCVALEPMLLNRIKQELQTVLQPKIGECFNSLRQKLQQYDYQEGIASIKIEIIPNNIIIKVDKKVSFIKNEQAINYNVFDTHVNSPMFEFARLTNEIINQELDCECGKQSCNADILDLIMKNPDFELEKKITGEKGDSEAYIIREFISGKEFRFAVRNCVRGVMK